LNRLAAAALSLALLTPAASAADDLPDPSRRADVVFTDKAAVLLVTVPSLPTAREGTSPPVRVSVDASFLGPHAKKKRLALKAAWEMLPTRESMDAAEDPDDVVVQNQASFCGRTLEAGATYLLALTRADDASSDCDLLQPLVQTPPVTLADASRVWDEHHGFAHLHRHADAVAPCEAVPDDPAALAAADLVAYAELPADGFSQRQNQSFLEARLTHAYKDTRATRSRDVELRGYTDDAYPLTPGTRVLLFAQERDGQLVATRCGGTREELAAPDAVADAPATPRHQIACARLPSEDASLHASALVAHAAVHDVVASSGRTQRLRMRPETVYKDTRETPDEFFDLVLDPTEGLSFEAGQRVLVFAEPMRNQFTADPCTPTRALDVAPADVAGARGRTTSLSGDGACRSEPITPSDTNGADVIAYGRVLTPQKMSTLALATLRVSHVYKGAEHVPLDRDLKFYYDASHYSFVSRRHQVLVFLERFDKDRLRVSSCGATRFLPDGPPDTILNLPATVLDATRGEGPIITDDDPPPAPPEPAPRATSCATTPGTPGRGPLALAALIPMLAALRRRR
jgi:hypothetical protein